MYIAPIFAFVRSKGYEDGILGVKEKIQKVFVRNDMKCAFFLRTLEKSIDVRIGIVAKEKYIGKCAHIFLFLG
jgi:hypothetical protein